MTTGKCGEVEVETGFVSFPFLAIPIIFDGHQDLGRLSDIYPFDFWSERTTQVDVGRKCLRKPMTLTVLPTYSR